MAKVAMDLEAVKAFEALTGVILRPMQGPLTFAQICAMQRLASDRWEGKRLAQVYESEIRAGRSTGM